MGISQVAERFFTYESRLASFQKAQPISKRRVSITSIKGGPKSMKWPHKYLSAQDLAGAGFFYFPTQIHPDNVACFLCHRALDGWEESDDPLTEHLKHSPNCGWAITATIEKLNGYLKEENPSGPKMVEARKATFAEKWPHENKRGWKCRTKQMVEGGWKYTPTSLNDDMVSCSYCTLSIHSWEKLDRPTDKHYESSPDCAFFTLSNSQMKNPATKKVRAQRARASKTSILSVQSNLTASTETTLIADLATDDSISKSTTLISKKESENKKAALGKTRKTRAKKSQMEETIGSNKVGDKAVESLRGKKRKSEEFEISENVVNTISPPKKRTTRSRGNTVTDVSKNTLKTHPSYPVSKKMPRRGRSTRKTSTASTAPSESKILDDGDDATNNVTGASYNGSDYEPSQVKKYTDANHHMFGLDPIHIDEAAIEAELNAMEIDDSLQYISEREKNLLAQENKSGQESGAKRGALIESQEIGTQDTTQQSLMHKTSLGSPSNSSREQLGLAPTLQAVRVLPRRLTRGSTMSSKNELSTAENHYTDESAIESGNETDDSIASPSTVASSNGIRSSIKNWRNEGLSRNIEEIVHTSEALSSSFSQQEQTRPARRMRTLNSDDKEISRTTPHEELDVEHATHLVTEEPAQSLSPKTRIQNSKQLKSTPSQNERIIQTESEMAPESQRESISSKEPDLIETDPRRTISPFPESIARSSVRQMSSSSSISSNAENRPPSSKYATFTNHTATPQTTRRVLISFSTPVHSPSKRHVATDLISNQPWTAVDLETIFLNSPPSPSGVSNSAGLLENAINRVRDGMLTTPEKNMTVEEWIHHNARVAEEKLRNECERIVGNFEREGMRAMRALEGIECCN
ncbi:hypothetical protein K3495_g5299 [Podosphaera aphanis]|nr:hypothetical protein K3495_g5299 [Podosphaera aphanis]